HSAEVVLQGRSPETRAVSSAYPRARIAEYLYQVRAMQRSKSGPPMSALGSGANISRHQPNVRFALESRQTARPFECPLCAKGLMHAAKSLRTGCAMISPANEPAGRTAMTKLARPLAFVLMTATMATGSAVFAEDTLKLTVGQRGLWDTSISDVGQRAGIFKKHGVTLEILYTQGSGETQQAVFAGSVDIGGRLGVMGRLAGYSKGAPVRIIGNEITGAGDVYWYVKSESSIKTIKDFDGKTVAFSTVGASTHGVVTAFIKQYGLTAAKPTQTGGPAPR